MQQISSTLRRVYAFTLVELLVVIGIIALLISMLLPSLNRAREQANMIDCQARLQEMGHALAIYESQYRGLLPWGLVDRDQIYTTTPQNQEPYWWWNFTLSEVLTGRSCLDSNGKATLMSPIFKDKDTIQGNDNYWVCHYTSNPRVLLEANTKVEDDYEQQGVALPMSQWHQRNITDVKNSSSVFVIWDGPQIADENYNTYPSAEWIDYYGWVSTGLVLENLTPPLRNSDHAIMPGAYYTGISGKTDGGAQQIKANVDFQSAFTGAVQDLSNLRFRHMNNTVLNALCLDGHVESRKVGTVMIKDIYTNFQQGQ